MLNRHDHVSRTVAAMLDFKTEFLSGTHSLTVKNMVSQPWLTAQWENIMPSQECLRAQEFSGPETSKMLS